MIISKIPMNRAEALALNLPNEKDRVLAIKWLWKLSNLQEREEKDGGVWTDVMDHITMMLLECLERNYLIGPFQELPPDGIPQKAVWEKFQPDDMAEMMRDKELADIGGIEQPFDTLMSGNMRQYLVSQEIPKFGMHFYFAFSKDPVPLWDNCDLAYVNGEKFMDSPESGDTSLLERSRYIEEIEVAKKVKAAEAAAALGAHDSPRTRKLKKLPPHLQERQRQREAEEAAVKDPALSPVVFRDTFTGPYTQTYKPEVFGLGNEQFESAEQRLHGVEWSPRKPARPLPGDATIERKDRPVYDPLGVPLPSMQVLADYDKFEEGVRERHLYETQLPRNVSPRLRHLYDRVEAIKTYQPRTLDFSAITVDIEPEEKTFRRIEWKFEEENPLDKPFVYSGVLPVMPPTMSHAQPEPEPEPEVISDDDDDYLTEDQMTTDDVFDEDPIIAPWPVDHTVLQQRTPKQPKDIEHILASIRRKANILSPEIAEKIQEDILAGTVDKTTASITDILEKSMHGYEPSIPPSVKEILVASDKSLRRTAELKRKIRERVQFAGGSAPQPFLEDDIDDDSLDDSFLSRRPPSTTAAGQSPPSFETIKKGFRLLKEREAGTQPSKENRKAPSSYEFDDLKVIVPKLAAATYPDQIQIPDINEEERQADAAKLSDIKKKFVERKFQGLSKADLEHLEQNILEAVDEIKPDLLDPQVFELFSGAVHDLDTSIEKIQNSQPVMKPPKIKHALEEFDKVLDKMYYVRHLTNVQKLSPLEMETLDIETDDEDVERELQKWGRTPAVDVTRPTLTPPRQRVREKEPSRFRAESEGHPKPKISKRLFEEDNLDDTQPLANYMPVQRTQMTTTIDMAPNVMKQTTERLQTLYEQPQRSQAITPEFRSAARERLIQLLEESQDGGLAGDALEDEQIQLTQDDYEDIYVDEEGNVQVEASKSKNVIYKHQDKYGADFDWLHELVPPVSPPRPRPTIEERVQATPKKAAGQKRRVEKAPKKFVKGGRPTTTVDTPKHKAVVPVKRRESLEQLSQAPSRRQLGVVQKPFLRRAGKGETAIAQPVGSTGPPKVLLGKVLTELDPKKLAEQNMHVTAHEYRVSPNKVIQVVHATAEADDGVQQPFSMKAPAETIADLHEKIRRQKRKQLAQRVQADYERRTAAVEDDMITLRDTPSPHRVKDAVHLSEPDDQPSHSVAELQEKMRRRREEDSAPQAPDERAVERPRTKAPEPKPETSKRQLSSAAPSRRQLPVVQKPFLKRSATSVSKTRLAKKK